MIYAHLPIWNWSKIPYPLCSFITYELERQVVLLVASCEVNRSGRCGREGSSTFSYRSLCGRSLSTYTLNLPGTDVVEPTILPLTAIDVERYGELFTQLDVELFNFVSSEEIETHLTGVLVVCFQHVFLCLPRITTSRNSLSCGEYGNYFST